MINRIILYIMAFGAVLGGGDYILGNRFGLGQRFAEALGLLGSVALSMAGILCLSPVLSGVLGRFAAPICSAAGIDPGMLGSILPIDMGGYSMAMELAVDPQIGRFSGVLISAMFGCTLVFTIPVGLGAMGAGDRPDFLKGILIGLVSLPAGILVGGLLSGLSFGTILRQTMPVLLLCGALLVGLLRKPEAMIRLFQGFAKGIRAVSGFGLTVGAVAYMTGWNPIPGFAPLMEAMEVACSIAIVMLGSMPLAELCQRLLRRPFAWVGRRTGLNEVSTTGLLLSVVSVVPALAMVPRMDRRGKVVCGAVCVCGASTFAAHLGYTIAAEPDMAFALLAAKLTGALLGAGLALMLELRAGSRAS